MCNISENYVAFVGICKDITILLLLSSINYIKTGAHKLSRSLSVTSKFYAPEW
jgi:hypothetical protein